MKELLFAPHWVAEAEEIVSAVVADDLSSPAKAVFVRGGPGSARRLI